MRWYRPHVPYRLDVEEFEMKFAWITAALVCFASLNSADAGLFGKRASCCAPAPSCCSAGPTCAAPAACAPTCAAPAACAPACAAPAPMACAPAAAPSCCAPAAAAPSCCAPAPTCCNNNYNACCGKKSRKGLRDMFGGLKNRMSKKNRCCAPVSCCNAAPTCAAPVACAPTCAAPAAGCCH